MKPRFLLLLGIGVMNWHSAWAVDPDQDPDKLAPGDRAIVRQLLQIDAKLTWNRSSSDHITNIGFSPSGATEKAISFLPGLTELKVLQVHQRFYDQVAGWKPGNLDPLARCAKLRELFLVIAEHHTVETWRSLPVMEQVEIVHIFDQTATSLPILDRFPCASQLLINTKGPPVLDRNRLGQLNQLKSMSLHSESENWKGEGLSDLSACPSLEEISVGGVGMSDIALVEIAKVPSMKHLTLRSGKITREGLVSLTTLESFRCSERRFNDELATGLVNCRGLMKLELSGSAVTGKCFEVLAKLPLEEIICSGLKTENLNLLKDCKTLRRIELSIRTREERQLQLNIFARLLPKVDLVQEWIGDKGTDPKSGK